MDEIPVKVACSVVKDSKRETLVHESKRECMVVGGAFLRVDLAKVSLTQGDPLW